MRDGTVKVERRGSLENTGDTKGLGIDVFQITSSNTSRFHLEFLGTKTDMILDFSKTVVLAFSEVKWV